MWLENVVTQELVFLRVAPEDSGGERLVADLWLQPGAAVMGEHVHDHIHERFTVLEGELSVVLDGQRSVAGPGTVLDIPAGRAHDWSNAGTEVAHALVELEAVPGSGPMAARFLAGMEAAFGLANTGRTNAAGRPAPLWLFAFAHEYADVLYLTRPPRAVQRALFGPLAALARRLGRDPAAAWLHGPGCPARTEARAAV
jgi:quercetin dioxygenase-like cupin family protein